MQLPYTSDLNGRAVAQAGSRRTLTTQAQVRSQVNAPRFVVMPDNYERSSALSEIGKHWTEICLHLIFQISVRLGTNGWHLCI